MHKRSRALLSNARELRKNMTKEERHIWYDFLRNCPKRFRRQEIIGPYIADFYCSAEKLVIELDGSQHCEPEGKARDLERSKFFNSLGIRVLRFSNLEVMRDFRGVCERILLEVGEEPSVDPHSGGSNPSVSCADSSPFRGA